MLLSKPAAAIALVTMLVLWPTSGLPAQVVVNLQAGRGTPSALVDRDPANSQERFMLLTPGGPIVVECALTFQGQPFRMEREKLILGLLERLQKNEQGKALWEAAAANPRSPLSQLLPRQRIGGTNELAKQQLIKQFDVNGDGFIERNELQRLVVNSYGDDFSLTMNAFGASPGIMFMELLDTDKDRALSASEIGVAIERLKSRDQDDNDLISAAELGGQVAGMYRIANAGGYRQAAPLAILLGPAGDLASAFNALQEKYHDDDAKLRAGCFPLLPQLIDQLDTNRNGEFERSEAAALNKISPHLVCDVNLASGTSRQAVRVKVAAPELESIAKVESRADDALTIRVPSLALTFTLGRSAQVINFGQQSQSYLDRFDKDKNGYLEASELEGQQGIAGLIESWDGDGDGKVYAAEITAALERQYALTQMKFNVIVADQGSPLFSAIDASNDGRVGLREMRAAAERLRTFDTNGDGQLASDEIPRQLALTIVRGNAGNQGAYVANAGGFTVARPAVADKADWFAAMDRNGDGDLSRREFLGSTEKFDQLDADHDDLLDRTEAGADK